MARTCQICKTISVDFSAEPMVLLAIVLKISLRIKSVEINTLAISSNHGFCASEQMNVRNARARVHI